jgi:MHS family shikimate/dehydroshikimate transporter-like MFS transporter
MTTQQMLRPDAVAGEFDPLDRTGPDPAQHSVLHVALASFVGTTIEWYDFLLYGTASALVFNRLFFPTLDPSLGTLAALATFAVGFGARPLGGAIFGHFGDTRGRKSMLVASLLLMGMATVAMGLLPTYEQVGVSAPIVLIGLRIAQGVGLGGEWGAAVALVVEHAPTQRRGFYASWPQLGAPAGLLLGNLAFLGIATLPESQLFTWGWRLPFVLSLVLVIFGLLVRRAVPDSPAFLRLKASHRQARRPLAEVLRHPRLVLIAGGSRCAEIGVVTVFTTFIIGYATQTLGLARAQTVAGLLIGILMVIVLVPISGFLADRFGSRRVYLFGALATVVLVVPACVLIDTGQAALLAVGMLVGLFGPAVMTGPQGSFFAELFATRIRYSGASLGFQLGAALVGGVAPVIAATLALATGNLASTGVFMLALAVASIACIHAAPRSRQEEEVDDGNR